MKIAHSRSSREPNGARHYNTFSFLPVSSSARAELFAVARALLSSVDLNGEERKSFELSQPEYATAPTQLSIHSRGLVQWEITFNDCINNYAKATIFSRVLKNVPLKHRFQVIRLARAIESISNRIIEAQDNSNIPEAGNVPDIDKDMGPTSISINTEQTITYPGFHRDLFQKVRVTFDEDGKSPTLVTEKEIPPVGISGDDWIPLVEKPDGINVAREETEEASLGEVLVFNGQLAAHSAPEITDARGFVSMDFHPQRVEDLYKGIEAEPALNWGK